MSDQSYLLSVVADKDGGQVYIHASKAGLERLRESINFLLSNLDEGECEHDHLFTKTCGSDGLSETMLDDEKAQGCTQVHHVKVYAWSEEWRVKHRL